MSYLRTQVEEPKIQSEVCLIPQIMLLTYFAILMMNLILTTYHYLKMYYLLVYLLF